MVESYPSSLTKERLRLRELAKYYKAVFTCGPNRRGSDEPLFVSATDEFKPSLPRLAADTQLTALAQLAAFRTGCQRSFISLIDHEAQHIIAEATRSISVFNHNAHDTEDGLLIGAQSLPLHFGVCPGTLNIFSGESDSFLEEVTNQANQDYVIIADLCSEAKTKDTPAMKHLPSILRYYVAVPLRSMSGAVLGSICVVDPSPRQPELNHAVVLQELAQLVVQHLENSRMKEDYGRAELLLSGLAHFVRGQDSMSAWSQTAPGQEFIPSVESQRSTLSVQSLTSLPASTSDRQSPDAVTGNANTESTDTSASSMARTTTTSSDTQDDVSKRSSVSSHGIQIDGGLDPSSPIEPTGVEPAQCLGGASTNVRHTFSRASNLIREAMDLDATMFLEIPHNDRFRHHGSRPRRFEAANAGDGGRPYTPTSDSGSLTDSSDVSQHRDESETDRNSDAEVLCHRLGYATKMKSSLVGSTVARPFMTIPAALLSRLALRYPQGHTFYFDSYGSVSSGDDNEMAAIVEHKTSLPLMKLSSRLHRVFPDARSLIFLPLFDNDKQQIYAGFIGMSCSPTRVLQKHESTYVSAFVNSLMCEVMRLEASKTDKAKSDFLSSISHELRSPLHGILASSQLLAESNIQPSQTEFVQMIDTCARTLLDTMDHLLNHTKINHYTQQQTENRESQDRRRGSQFKPYSLVASTNMLSVVEETTASMAASSNQMLQNVEGIRSSSGSDEVLSVPVLLDISPHEFWKFDTEVGSWRRMIMNLVGNSLKYTKQGHVKVSFGLRRRSDTKFLAEFRITDTGQGISEEYLKHRLYTPFSQENNLSVGTGLGLSTVRQIVSSLHGDMRVYSEVGSGTEVSIKVPLGVSTNTEVQQIQAITDTNLLEVVRQQTFCFAGFDERPLLREEPTGIQSPRVKTLVAMKNSLSNLLSQWFNSRLVDNGASVIVVEESFLENNLGDLDRPNQNLLVIGLEGRRSTVTNQINHAAHVCLLPPVGPTRMAAALKLLLEEQNTLRSLNLETSDESDRSKLRSSTSEAEPIVPCPLTIDHHKSREAILLVDDNDINLRILVTCIGRLKLQDVNLLTASDGREAVVKYTAAIEGGIRISVVFMDISMPIMDGFQATRQIRLFESDRGLAKHDRAKIMALTGLASAEALNEVKASDFDSYLRKPVNLRTIREVLAAARI